MHDIEDWPFTVRDRDDGCLAVEVDGPFGRRRAVLCGAMADAWRAEASGHHPLDTTLMTADLVPLDYGNMYPVAGGMVPKVLYVALARDGRAEPFASRLAFMDSPLSKDPSWRLVKVPTAVWGDFIGGCASVLDVVWDSLECPAHEYSRQTGFRKQ